MGQPPFDSKTEFSGPEKPTQNSQRPASVTPSNFEEIAAFLFRSASLWDGCDSVLCFSQGTRNMKARHLIPLTLWVLEADRCSRSGCRVKKQWRLPQSVERFAGRRFGRAVYRDLRRFLSGLKSRRGFTVGVSDDRQPTTRDHERHRGRGWLTKMLRASDPTWRQAIIAFNAKQSLLRLPVTPASVVRARAIGLTPVCYRYPGDGANPGILLHSRRRFRRRPGVRTC